MGYGLFAAMVGLLATGMSEDGTATRFLWPSPSSWMFAAGGLGILIGMAIHKAASRRSSPLVRLTTRG